MPEGVFTNGIDIDPAGRFLFVVGNDGVFRVEIATREVVPLSVPDGEAIYYGDGLYFHEGSLIIIASWMAQEALHYRVARMTLSQEMTAIEEVQVMDQDHPLFAYPTTGVINDGWFYYIASAQFDKVDGEGVVAPWDELSDIYLLRVRIPQS